MCGDKAECKLARLVGPVLPTQQPSSQAHLSRGLTMCWKMKSNGTRCAWTTLRINQTNTSRATSQNRKPDLGTRRNTNGELEGEWECLAGAKMTKARRGCQRRPTELELAGFFSRLKKIEHFKSGDREIGSEEPKVPWVLVVPVVNCSDYGGGSQDRLEHFLPSSDCT